MVLDVIALATLGRHVHGAHAHGVRRRQVARVVLEHRGLRGICAVECKDSAEGAFLGLGAVARVLDSIDRVEGCIQPTRPQHLRRIGRAAIGVDDLAPGQRGDQFGQVGVGGERVEGDVVHFLEIGVGIDVMLGHQSCQRGAMQVPVGLAQGVGLAVVGAGDAHDEIGHLALDLVEETGGGRIERVVEVEDPVTHVREMLFHHGGDPSPGAAARQWAH